MNIKEKLLNLPVWKVALFLFLVLISLGIVFEEVMAHSFFNVLDRALTGFENQKKEDVADLDEMDKREQSNYCEKYRELQREKSEFAKKSGKEFGYDFDFHTIKGHEIEINVAIQSHFFDLKKCDRALS